MSALCRLVAPNPTAKPGQEHLLRSKFRSMRIDQLLQEAEGKRLEFKRDLSSPRHLMKTLVAFANTAGGLLVIGVEDGSKAVVGVPDRLAAEQQLANTIADSITPKLLADIEVLPWRKSHVLAAKVALSPSRPHYVNAEGPEGGVYVRLGSTNRRADASQIAELKRRPNEGSYDEQPMPELDAKAIDFAAVAQQFEGKRELRQKDLATLGLTTQYQGKTVPTIGGILLFGRDRFEQFPDAWIKAASFAGPDKARILDQADLRDPLIPSIRAAIAFVERNTLSPAVIGPVERRDLRALPPVALREAMVNAAAHADYAQRGSPIRVAVFADRVEIENPGILVPGLTVEALVDGVSKLRNRVIGRVFHELGLAEQWGSGIQRMIAECKAAGLPPPEFQETGHHFRVTLRLQAVQQVQLDDVDRALIAFLDKVNGRSTAEIAVHLKKTPRTTQQRLGRLQERGMAVPVGSGPKDPRRRWFLGPNAAVHLSEPPALSSEETSV